MSMQLSFINLPSDILVRVGSYLMGRDVHPLFDTCKFLRDLREDILTRIAQIEQAQLHIPLQRYRLSSMEIAGYWSKLPIETCQSLRNYLLQVPPMFYSNEIRTPMMLLDDRVLDARNNDKMLEELAEDAQYEGQIEKAVMLANGMQDDKKRKKWLKKCVLDYRLPLETALKITQSLPKGNMQNTILEGLASKTKGEQEIEEAISIANTIHNDNDFKCAVLRSYAFKAELPIKTALKIASDIPDKSIKDDTLNELARRVVKNLASKYKEDRIIMEIINLAGNTKNDHFKTLLFRNLALKEGVSFDGAVLIANGIPDEECKGEALAALALRDNETMECSAALKFAELISNPYWKSIALCNFASSKTISVGEAVKIANAIPEKDQKNKAFYNIALREELSIDESLAFAKLIEDNEVLKGEALAALALRIRDKETMECSAALKFAELISNPYGKSRALCIFAASKTISVDEAVKIVHEIPETEQGQKNHAFSEIALRKELSIDESLAYAEFIKDDDELKNMVLSNLAIKGARNGFLDRSLEIARNISIPSERLYTLQKIAENQAEIAKNQEEFAKALDIATEILPDTRRYDATLQTIALNDAISSKAALESAGSIVSVWTKSYVLKELLQRSDINNSEKKAIAASIPDPDVREMALNSLSTSTSSSDE